MSLMLLLQTSNGVPMLGLARGDTVVFDTSALPEWRVRAITVRWWRRD